MKCDYLIYALWIVGNGHLILNVFFKRRVYGMYIMLKPNSTHISHAYMFIVYATSRGTYMALGWHISHICHSSVGLIVNQMWHNCTKWPETCRNAIIVFRLEWYILPMMWTIRPDKAPKRRRVDVLWLVSHLIFRLRHDDSDISDMFTLPGNLWFVHSQYVP